MKFDNYMHVGIVVRDAEKVMKNLEEIFGIGPFNILNFPPDNVNADDIEMTYHGEKADFKAKFCFAQVGTTEIELIEPIEGNSVWYEFLEEKGEGIHHIKFKVPSLLDTKEYLEGHDIEMTQSGSAVGANTGKTWAYFGSEEQVGFIMEVLNEELGEKVLK